MSWEEALENAAKAQELKAQIYKESVPSPGQMSNFAGMLVPGAGILDAAGTYPALPSRDQPYIEAFSNEPYPSMDENLARGGWGYLDATLQGLGVAGDALYATQVGAPVGLLVKGLGSLGAAMRTGSKAGKVPKTETGIVSLGKEPMFTPEDTFNLAYTPDGSYSPGIKDLIEKAPVSLKGQGITQWANKNLKPKELEVLGIDEFIKANPKATLKETVEGISGNKVVVGKKVLSGEGQVMDFDITTPLEDPLDGSKVYQFEIDDIMDELEGIENHFGTPEKIKGYSFQVHQDLTDTYNNFSHEYGVPEVKSFADIPKVDNEVYEAALDRVAKNRYMDNPYELIRPTGVGASNNTFAFGNDDVGYQLFVDGKRVTGNDNLAYSQTEAQIQLRDNMADQGYDMFRLSADDYVPDFDHYGGGTQYKQFIDNSLPGGDNYREILYTYENARETHNIGHFGDAVDGNYLAHALVRDRKLADGTETLHGDELQSDLHRDGAKHGYNSLEKRKSIEEARNIAEQNMSDSFDNLKPLLDKYALSDLPESISAPSTSPVSADTLIDDVNKAFRGKGVSASQWANELPRDINEALIKYENAASEVGKTLHQEFNLVPNYPYKDDYHEMLLKKMLLQAVEEGKPAISVSGSAPIKARYETGNDAVDEKNFRFYENLYDKKIPSYMEKLAKKYGGEFQKNSKLDFEDTFGGGRFPAVEDEGIMAAVEAQGGEKLYEANVIKITEEMRNKILLEGIPDFATGGIVNKGIARLRTAKQSTEGIVDLGLY